MKTNLQQLRRLGRNSLLVIVLGVVPFGSRVSVAAPRWTVQTPIGKHHIYAVGIGEAQTTYDARRSSITDAMRSFSEQRNVTIETRFHSLTTEDRRQIEDEISINGTSTTLKGLRLVETYSIRQNSSQQVWTLMSLPSSNEIGRWSSIWRSAILPGWGQFYQGQPWRGGLLLAGTVIGVGGALYTKARQQDFENQGSSSVVPSTRQYYYDQADKYHQGNVAFVSLAVVSYALNLADVLFSSSNKADIYYAILVVPNGRLGISVAFK
jgi:hypothetical protein